MLEVIYEKTELLIRTSGTATFMLTKKLKKNDQLFDLIFLSDLILFVPISQTKSAINRSGVCYFFNIHQTSGACTDVCASVNNY